MTSSADRPSDEQRPRKGAQARGRGAPARRVGPAVPRTGRVPPAAQRPRRSSTGQPDPRRAGPRRTAGRADQEPPPPEDADVNQLSEDVRAELRGLSPDNADRVGRHLVAAGRLLEDDPLRALEHARAARRTAARLAAVREAVGLAAYLSGQWQEALTELRAVRRMTGDSTHLPLLADCERGLGRPVRALALARSPEATSLGAAERVELRIVEAGARRDLGQVEAALLVLRDAGLALNRTEEWTSRLWYAYADTLVAAGQPAQARQWFEAVVAVDDEELTDAADRLAELDGNETPPDETERRLR